MHLIPSHPIMTTTLGAVQALWHCTNINVRDDNQCREGLIIYGVQGISKSRCKIVSTIMENTHHVVLYDDVSHAAMQQA